ncbi:WD40/YVTN/BNR-like repeat-containing protein, partial [Acinetobacter baumannii]|uniref:WD40/YVTN/BNR-like repeat-containing protein n=2 Tax=Pseudomonadota TaxID=1224 RepID=UPI0039F0F463
MLLDATRAGKRVVAVGEHGIVLLSDDEGKTYRQARTVPVSATLSAVSFADEKHGWAVGQWGVILATSDGGETWVKQRMDTAVDQPLFSVVFT